MVAIIANGLGRQGIADGIDVFDFGLHSLVRRRPATSSVKGLGDAII
jgi:hypothetical protein